MNVKKRKSGSEQLRLDYPKPPETVQQPERDNVLRFRVSKSKADGQDSEALKLVLDKAARLSW